MSAKEVIELPDVADENNTAWFCRADTRHAGCRKPVALKRFLTSPRTLFIASIASWPILLLVLAVCAWIQSPYLQTRLPSLIGGIGFACAGLSVVDCGQPLYPQHRRLLFAFLTWAGTGALSWRLFVAMF